MAQAALNLFAVLGLAPLTGVPLPFVSYGGTSLILTLACCRADPECGPEAGRRPGRRAQGLRPRWSQTATGPARLRWSRAEPMRGCAERSEVQPAGVESGQQVARVVIAAGGTAGHVVPAIAVADALRAEGSEVSFLGTRGRAEADLVPAAGYEIDFLRVSGLSRRNPLKAARASWQATRAVGAARHLLERRRAEVVLGGGGYVAGPAGLAAVRMGLPLVLTEADSHLGLANRLLARRARRVCLAFPIPGRDGGPYLVTGRPVPRAGARGRPDGRPPPLRHSRNPRTA